MKPVKPILFFAYGAFLFFIAGIFPASANAQCTSATKSISYTIQLNGTGNNVWGFSLPQFDPSVGTLISVDIKSVVSANIKFQLENTGSAQATYSVAISREDSIIVSALSTPITNYYSQNEGPYTLQPFQDTVGAGVVGSSQPITLLSSYPINDSITTSTANFLGLGYVSFSYIPQTIASVTGGSSYYLNSTALDTMNISLVYYYCNTNILAESITDFSVSKESDQFALLAWNTENETWGNEYEIEESNSGKQFDSVATISSVVNNNGVGNYKFNYPINPGAKGKLYFRLKETNGNGQTKYSEIKYIDLDNNNAISIYPNPANNFLNISFNEASSSGWLITIFSADGRLMQTNSSINSTNLHINFAATLAKGAYFIRVINRDSQKTSVLPFEVL